MPQALEVRRQRRDPTRLWKTAGNPVDRFVARKRLFGGVGVGGLRIIDIAYAVDRIYQFLTMCEAGKSADAGDRCLRREAGEARGGVGGGRVLRVVRAG